MTLLKSDQQELGISEVSIFLTLIAVSTLFAIAAAFYLLSRRSVPGALFLSLAEFSVVFWNIGYFIEIFADTLSVKMTGVKIQYFFGIPFTGIFWFLTILDYTNFRRRSFFSIATLLCIIPFLTMIFALTMESHQMLYRNTRLLPSGDFILITKDWGPWFHVHVYYSYLILLISAGYLIYFLRNQKILFRGQASLLLGSFAVPITASVIYVLGMNSFMRLDFTNIAFTYTALVMGYAVQKYRLFDIIPAARDAVFESMEEGILVVDAAGRIVDYNPALLRTFPQANKIGSPAATLFEGTPLKTENIFNSTEASEITIGGCVYQISSSALSERGKNFGYILTFHDVTKLKDTENKLNELNLSKDQLFSIIAHDLKNPFFGLIGLSEILRVDYDVTDDDYKKLLIREINMLSVNTHQLLDNLLDWSRQQTNQIAFRLEYFSLTASLESSLVSLRQIAKNKGIEIINNSASLIPIYADKYMIDTVIRNLISNAIKFSNGGTSITIDSFQKDGFGGISVTDEGVGMSEKALKQVFSVLDKIKTSGTRGENGSGLGLMLCKEFIEKNYGTITAESTRGKGSCFTITLPLRTEK